MNIDHCWGGVALLCERGDLKGLWFTKWNGVFGVNHLGLEPRIWGLGEKIAAWYQRCGILLQYLGAYMINPKPQNPKPETSIL